MSDEDAKVERNHESEVDVDLILERDISAAEQAVDAYLLNPNESLRRDLMTVLEQLDSQLAEGDAYHARLRFPFGSVSSVVGATGDNSVAEELPASQFQAQVTLVKAAKNAVTRLTPDTLADLRAASEALGAWRSLDQ